MNQKEGACMNAQDLFFTYYAEAREGRRPLAVPEEHVSTYFETIQEMAAIPPETSRGILQAGLEINTARVRFYAAPAFHPDRLEQAPIVSGLRN